MKKDTDKIIHDRPEEEDEPEETDRHGTSQSKKVKSAEKEEKKEEKIEEKAEEKKEVEEK